MSARARVLTVLGIIAAVAAGVVAVGVIALRRFEAHQIARESHTVVEAIRKVARLSTVEMNVSSFQLKKDSKNLLGFIPIRCEKTVAIFYKGKVAAGFDFQEAGGLKLTTVPGTRRLLVELPPARLLYTDAPPPEVVVADGSLCNQLEASDYQTLTAEARGALEREALNAGILRRAEDHARELVQTVAGPLGFQAEVRLGPQPASVSTSALR